MQQRIFIMENCTMFKEYTEGTSPAVTVSFNGFSAEWLSHVEDAQEFLELCIKDFFISAMMEKSDAIRILQELEIGKTAVVAAIKLLSNLEINMDKLLWAQCSRALANPEHYRKIALNPDIDAEGWLGLIGLLQSDDVYHRPEVLMTYWSNGFVRDHVAFALTRLAWDYRASDDPEFWFECFCDDWDTAASAVPENSDCPDMK